MKFLERSFDRQNQFWKYVIVILGAFIGGQLIGSIPLICVIAYKIFTGVNITLNPANMADLTGFGISKNVNLLLTLIIFAVSLIVAILLIKVLHKRSFAEVVNGTKKIRINRCLSGAAIWTILMALYLCGDYFINGQDYILQFNLAKFIPLLFIALIFIPLQTSFEEFIFRGYLTQGFAQLTKSRCLAVIIPGLLFGLIHVMNPEVKAFGFWISMSQYVFFGLIFGFIAVLDDGIELPMGMHAANNIFLCLFITNQSSAIQSDAVLEQININPTKEAVVLIVVGIIAFIYFAVKYKWNLKILQEKVTPNT